MNGVERMELKISRFLRWGVISAGSVIAIGWIMSFKADSDPFAPLQTYQQLTLLQGLKVQIILENWGKLIAYVGLGMLISLPVIRVILSVILLLKSKEKTMALIGALVLVGLILSFSLGIEI